MKNAIIALLFITMMFFTGCQSGKQEIDSKKIENSEKEILEKLKFDKNDEVVKGLSLGMTQEEVKKVLGEPESIVTNERETFLYGDEITYNYKEMRLSFYDIYEGENLTLGSVDIFAPDISLTNGLKVGLSADEILASYYKDGQDTPLGTTEKWGKLLYGSYLFTSETGYKKPEKYEQTAFYTLPTDEDYHITYDCYTPVNESAEDISLVFYINKDGIVDSIRWSKSLLN